MPAKNSSDSTWTLLSNHSHVLICLAQNPELRLRDVAAQVNITERAVQRIVSDLEEAGMITRIRDGRRNRYRIHGDQPLRNSVKSHCNVGHLLSMILGREAHFEA